MFMSEPVLQSDFDVEFVQPVQKRRRLFESKLLESRPLGPRTHADADGWVHDSFRMLKECGQRFFGVDFSVQLLQRLEPSRGVCMRTDYSGLGGPEEALEQIIRALQLDDSSVRCQRAGDKEQHIKALLLARRGPSRPECVHGDIVERFPAHALAAISTMREEYVEKAEAAENKGQAYESLGKEFVQLAFQHLMQQLQTVRMSAHTAPCARHGRACEVLPAPPAGFQGLLCSVSGVNCYDFSSMGACQKFLGKSVIPFLMWAAERCFSCEDFFHCGVRDWFSR